MATGPTVGSAEEGCSGESRAPPRWSTHLQIRLKLVAIAAALVATTAVAGVGARAATTTTSVPATTGTVPAATGTGAATTTSVGSCHGLVGLASVKSDYTDPNDGLPAGLVANIPTAGANHDVRISIKGVAGPNGSFGTCTFSGANTPGAGTYTVTRWTALLVSPSTDCLGDVDAAEYPLNGKATIEFSDGTRTQTYSQTTFSGGTANDLFTQSGVVTQGNGLGALFQNQIYWAPITKLPNESTPSAPYPGYEYDNATAAACAGNPPGANADARDLIVGDGVSPLTGQTASGYTFSVGN